MLEVCDWLLLLVYVCLIDMVGILLFAYIIAVDLVLLNWFCGFIVKIDGLLFWFIAHWGVRCCGILLCDLL